jgi:hypothetical protein
MRYLVKIYEDGSLFAIETSDDGSSIVRPLKGSREVGKRLSAFVEVLCDDTAEGMGRIQDALAFVSQTVSQRVTK